MDCRTGATGDFQAGEMRHGPQVILFDAVGTLIYPEPPVAKVYGEVARQHGIALPSEEIGRRFRLAFQEQEAIDAANGQRTDEPRERERWQGIVAEVFHDQAGPSAPFEDLWNHFAKPEHWATYPEVGDTLSRLAGWGIVLGMASNFDGRLRGIVAGLPALAPIRELFISSEMGWKKPAAEFYQSVLERIGQPAEEVLMVGDHPVNDAEPAGKLGMRTAIVDRSAGRDLVVALTPFMSYSDV